MNESTARQILLLQAFETVQPGTSRWTDDDARRATQRARREHPDAADFDGYLAQRSRESMAQLSQRHPEFHQSLRRFEWRPAWPVGAALVCAGLGLLVDGIGATRAVNLLAPPYWAVVVWNLAVYCALSGHALAAAVRPKGRVGRCPSLALGFIRRLRALAGEQPRLATGAADRLRVAGRYSALAWPVFAPLWAARASLLFHTAAAALALGLIAGMYVRGLVWDYRAYWESTFLDATSVHAFLATVLAPAALVTGIDVPSAQALESIRAAHGSRGAGASAAPWIHLLSMTLTLFVVLPRAALAVLSGWHCAHRAGSLALPMHDPYFRRLAREQSGMESRVNVCPYAHTLDELGLAGLRAALEPTLGPIGRLRMAPARAYGSDADRDWAGEAADGGALAVVVCDLAATPEPENHGRFAREMALRSATIIVVDEAGFRKRFGALTPRLEQRRQTWTEFARALGTVPVFVDLSAPDCDAAASNARVAIEHSVSPAAA